MLAETVVSLDTKSIALKRSESFSNAESSLSTTVIDASVLFANTVVASPLPQPISRIFLGCSGNIDNA